MHSPRQAALGDPALAALQRRCGSADAALQAVAGGAAQLALGTGRVPNSEELIFQLRAQGLPYVRPRSWLVRGDVAADQLEARLQRWLDGWHRDGERRCGLSRVHGDGTAVTAAIVVDVLVDVRSIPIQTELGTPQDLVFSLRSLATNASVIALGPDGPPEQLQAELRGSTLRATWRPHARGRWVVQAVVDVAGGPRAWAEAWLFAGTAPPKAFSYPSAPGESQLRADSPPESALLHAINVARAHNGLAPLLVDSSLTELAREHAQQMLTNEVVAHDAGRGGPERRAEDAGITARAVGENVARASSAHGAHRLLWASPSHRGNLLHEHYDAVGIGVIEGDGEVWVCQLFAEGLAKSTHQAPTAGRSAARQARGAKAPRSHKSARR